MHRYNWRAADFRPAPAGWQVVFLEDEEGLTTLPMPGWLIEEETEPNEYGEHIPTGSRRVVPAFVTEGELAPAPSMQNYWLTLSPGEDPAELAEEEQAARRQRAELDAVRRVKRAEETAAA